MMETNADVNLISDAAARWYGDADMDTQMYLPSKNQMPTYPSQEGIS